MAIKDKITRRFSLTKPIMYQGEEYPSADATIYDGNGNETEGTVFADANGQYYTTDSNGNAISVMPVHTLDEVTVTGPKRYNVLGDTFKKSLATKPKEYDTTLMGLASGVLDKLRGNNTYTYNPSDPGSVRPYNPDEVDWGKTRRSQNKVVNAVSGTWGPLVTMATAPALASSMISAPLATMATLAGGAAGGYAVDKASEALTGRDIGTNVAMYTPLSPDLGEMLNPGYYVGGYGTERRMLDALYNQVTPYSYTNDTGLIGSIPKTKEFGLAIKDFFTPKRIRTSVNDTPAWKQRIDFDAMGEDAAWTNLYRDDAWRLAMRQKPRTIDIAGKPHSLYIKNPDGTYRYDLEYINQRRADVGIAPLGYTDLPVFTNKGELHEGMNNVVAGDAFTGNGGFVNVDMKLPKDWDIPTPSSWDYSIIDTQHPLRVRDKWDTQPFIDPNRSIAPAFSRWLTIHPNKVTNYIKNIDAVEAVGGKPFMLDMQVEPNVFRDIIVGK